MIYRGVVVTGSDTAAGKTVVSCALIMLFAEAGFKTGALKPVETGCRGPDRAPEDGLLLARAAGIALSEFPVSEKAGGPRPWLECSVEDVVPWRFKEPLAPQEAAKREGTELTVDRIFQAMDRWTAKADFLLVETAGGVMVPLNPRFTTADLLAAVDLPVVVVAANRLGVINHTLLTLEALRAREIPVAAVILNQTHEKPDQSADSNRGLIEEHGKVKVFETPWGGKENPAAEVREALRPVFPELKALLEKEWARMAMRYLPRGQGRGQGQGRQGGAR